MNKIEAVIFDMDGVIIDSEPLYFKIQNELFNELGFSVLKSEYNTFIGAGMQLMWEKLSSKFDLPFTVNKLISMNNKLIYRTFSELPLLTATDGFHSFLKSLKESKIKTAVASSTSKRTINVILSRLNVIQEFDTIVSSEEVQQGKPEADIFLEAARRINVKPDNCLVIEDSSLGVQAARKAGMHCVGFTNTNPENQDLSSASIIVSNFDKIDLESISY